MPVKVRFAPSPTGYLHIGGLRTALYNFLFARHEGGEFLLRIEDTDRERYVADAEKDILEMLEWAGLKWDNEVIEHQSAHLDRYREYAEKLVASGNAYYCSCTTERLSELRKEQAMAKEPMKYDGRCRPKEFSPSPPNLPSGRGGSRNTPPARGGVRGGGSVIRLKVPETGETGFEDLIHGEVKFENKLLDDQVLLKSDGFPTYHLANVVDDHLMKITHVIRGEEWIPSTPKHVLLYQAFGWDLPKFAHLPLLLSPQGGKLSKRQMDVAARDYKEKGYLPEALVNFVALLGWNPSADRELYRLDDLIAEFDIAKVNKSGTAVNFEKLDWMNSHYLRQKPDDEFVDLCLPYLQRAGMLTAEFTESYAAKAILLEKTRVKKLSEIVDAVAYFFVRAPAYEAKLLAWKEMTLKRVGERLNALYGFLHGLPEPMFQNPATLEHSVKTWLTEKEYKTGEILWPMRVALSGRAASPGPFEIASVLGKAKTLKRIEVAIDRICKFANLQNC